MKTLLIATGLALSLLPITASAAAPHYFKKAPAKSAAAMYQCQKCHMKVSAATAKKDGYKDPMDGGKFVPMKAAAKGSAGNSMPGMKM